MEQEKSPQKTNFSRTSSRICREPPSCSRYRSSFDHHSSSHVMLEVDNRSRLNSVTSSIRSRPGVGFNNGGGGGGLTKMNNRVYDSKIEKRKRDQYKLTRTLITVVFFVLLSEISSIVTYDKISEKLVAPLFKDIKYMITYYKLQVFISNLIVLIVHSVNFFLYCAFNKKYLIIFKQKYLFLFNLVGKLKCKKSVNQAQVV